MFNISVAHGMISRPKEMRLTENDLWYTITARGYDGRVILFIEYRRAKVNEMDFCRIQDALGPNLL